MTPFVKRNFLIPVSVALFTGLLYGLDVVVPRLAHRLQHPEILAISLMIMMSLVIMFFWVSLGAFGGLASFLLAMIFLYGPITNFTSYYYSVLIIAFFLSSFLGYQIYRKINESDQGYTITTEKIREDTNLIREHLKNRRIEVEALELKVDGLFKLKNIADSLSLALSEDDIIRTVSENAHDLFGMDKRVLFFANDRSAKEICLSCELKPETRRVFPAKKGGIFEKWALKNMKSLLIKDAREDFRFALTDEEKKDDAVSLIIKPLAIENNVLGLIRVDSQGASVFDQHELRVLDIVGELAAVALENARLYRQTEELAVRDSLTGLYVYRYFMERLEEDIKRALRSNGTFSVLMLDIDNFKDFNDKHGHILGDKVIRNIGRVLRSKAAAGDIAARYGGEEFVFMSLGSGRQKAVGLAEEIRQEIQNSFVTTRREKYSVSVSIGVAIFPEDAKLRDEIIWEADKRMYKAKTEGKNRVCFE